MGAGVLVAALAGIVLASFCCARFTLFVVWYLHQVKGEVALLNSRLQDVWSIDTKEIKADDTFESCGQSSCGELICRAVSRAHCGSQATEPVPFQATTSLTGCLTSKQ